ncbi:MAG TPA: hypothetical protein VLZ72_02065 [Flavobacterium sp.]|nr:hypothetical protein [Flavobacterium sp.]
MKLQQEMYSEVEKWKSSGQSRADFIKGKAYTLSKFNYWLNRYRKENIKSTRSNFKEIPIKKSLISPALKQEKALQIDFPSGIKITIYQ